VEKQKEVIGSLVTIGDELLLGDIPNGNAHYIASTLRSAGFRLRRMTTVGDVEEEIIETLVRHLDQSDFLIGTGGLGPTEDDRTLGAVSKGFDVPLVPNADYRSWLEKYMAERGRAWSDEAEKMTMLPDGAAKLGVGMAGFSIVLRGKPCYFLPGVPHEMRILMDEWVLPDLKRRFPYRPVYVKIILRVQGLPESEIGKRLKELASEESGVGIGYLPQTGENWVSLFAAGESEGDAKGRLQSVMERVISRLGSEVISGQNEEGLERVIGRQLREKGWKLAAAESCTGGLLSRRITAIAGASDYFDRAFVTYSNQAKMELLGVSEAMLRAHGAVSEAVAKAMAAGARARAGVDVAVAITGIAGPSGGSPQKPVGTVFIGCESPLASVVERYFFTGDREWIQEKAAQAALVLLWRILGKK